MNITTELEKLVALRDSGNLTQSEFEKAKAKLLSEEGAGLDPEPQMVRSATKSKGVNGVMLALGVFAGNFLFIAVSSGNIQKAIGVGGLAAVLVLLFYAGMAALKGK